MSSSSTAQEGNACAGWWGPGISEIYVDVASITDEQKRALKVRPCCTGAGGALATCGLWLAVFGLLPFFLCLVSAEVHVPAEFQTWAAPVAVVLVSVGLCWCCCSIKKTCCTGIFNIPEPAASAPPFSTRSHCRLIQVRSVLVVYNPNSGKRRASDLCLGVVVPGLQKFGVRCELAETERVGHAREIGFSRDLQPFDALIAIGGDGTLHELVNGMFARRDGCRKPVAVVPLGSGNGLFASMRQNMLRYGKEVRVWDELEQVLGSCVKSIAQGCVAKMDLIEVEALGGKLVSVMQVYLGGTTATIDLDAEPFRWMGPARFDLLALWSLFKKQACGFKCKATYADGAVEEFCDTAHLIGMGLNQHVSDVMRMSPISQLDDGLAELWYASSGRSVDESLAGFLQVGSGAHTAMEYWQQRQVVELAMEFDEGPGVFGVDGEVLRHGGSLTLRVLPLALDVLVDDEVLQHAAPASQGSRPCHWKAYPRRWAMLGITSCCIMVNQAIWIGFSPIESEVTQVCGVSVTWANNLSLVFMVAYAFSTFPASYAMDAFGCRMALHIGVALNLLGAVMRCILTVGPGASFLLMFAGQAICALAQPFFVNMCPKIAVVWFPSSQRALADAIATVSVTLGAGVGYVLPDALGLQSMLYVHLGWSSLAALLVVLCFEDKPPTPASPSSEHLMGSLRQDLAALASNRSVWGFGLAFASSMGCATAVGTVGEALITPFGFGPDEASAQGAGFCILGIIGAFVMVAAVSFTERFKSVCRACLLASAVCFLVAMLSVFVPEQPSFGLLWLAMAGAGFFSQPVVAVAFEASSRVAYPAGEGTVAGIYMTGAQLLGILHTKLLEHLLSHSLVVWAWFANVVLLSVGFLAVVLTPEVTLRIPLQLDSDASPSQPLLHETPLLEVPPRRGGVGAAM